jgi:agmatine deiminase
MIWVPDLKGHDITDDHIDAVVPRFGDRHADAAARPLAAVLYPGREVIQLTINNLAEGGGGIHCVTQ